MPDNDTIVERLRKVAGPPINWTQTNIVIEYGNGNLYREAADTIESLMAEVARLRTRPIVGWMVHMTSDIRNAAIYSLPKKDEAFDAAKRWGASVTAVHAALDFPAIDAALADGDGAK